MWHTPSERVDRDLTMKRKEILVEELIRWDNRYKERNEEIFFAVGKQFTLADIFLFPQLALLVHCGYPIRLHPSISNRTKTSAGKSTVFPSFSDSYYEHLRHRPSIETSFPPHWLKHTSTILADCADFFPKTEL